MHWQGVITVKQLQNLPLVWKPSGFGVNAKKRQKWQILNILKLKTIASEHLESGHFKTHPKQTWSNTFLFALHILKSRAADQKPIMEDPH